MVDAAGRRDDCMGVISWCRLRNVRAGDCKGQCALRAKDNFPDAIIPKPPLLDVTVPLYPALGLAGVVGVLTVMLIARRAGR